MPLSEELAQPSLLRSINAEGSASTQNYLIVFIASLLLSVTAALVANKEHTKETMERVIAGPVSSEHQEHPSPLRLPGPLRLAAIQQDILARIKQHNLAHYVSSETSENTLALNIQSELLFDEGSIILGRAGRAALNAVFAHLDVSGIAVLIEINARRDIESEYLQTNSIDELKSERLDSVYNFLATEHPSISRESVQIN
jgi:flagellar motor protein MotB